MGRKGDFPGNCKDIEGATLPQQRLAKWKFMQFGRIPTCAQHVPAILLIRDLHRVI